MNSVIYVLVFSLASCILAQNAKNSEQLRLAAHSEGRFATSLFAEIGRSVGSDNVVFNPLTVWSIFAMVFSSAEGATKNEIAAVLNIDADKSSQVDEAYQALTNAISSKTDQIESRIANLVVKTSQISLKDEFVARSDSVFKAKQFSIDFSKQKEAAMEINKWASDSTNQRITEIVSADDFKGMSLLLGSAAYFKGKWKLPFPINATSSDKFKNEDDVIISQKIDMMRNRGIYSYRYLPELESQVIDIPYHADISMIVVLPRRKVKLQSVLERMSNKSLAELIPSDSMTAEEIDLSLPKFSTSFNGIFNEPLYNMGVKTVLNEGAQLPGISDKAFISKVTHKAEIETNEVGTEASAATVAHVVYKTTPINFQANRPFIYFVIHSPSRAVLFAGKYSEPRNT